MANIDSTASNTNRMREHLFLKQMRGPAQHEQEEDLCVCADVVNFNYSVCLNGLEPSKTAFQAGDTTSTDDAFTRQVNSTDGEVASTSVESDRKDWSCRDNVKGTGVEHGPKTICSSETEATSSDYGKTKAKHVEFATVQDVLKANPTDKCLVSDVDEQLLFNIFFNSPVRITSVAIRSTVPPPGFVWKKRDDDFEGTEDDELPEDDTIAEPKLVKVYSNNSNLDFSTVTDETPAQSITFTKEQLKGEERVPLRGSKFQRCSSLHLFIEKNRANAMHTFLNRVCLFGYVNKDYVS